MAAEYLKVGQIVEILRQKGVCLSETLKSPSSIGSDFFIKDYQRPSQVMGIVLFVGRIKLKSAVGKILIHIRMQCLCDGVGQNGSAVLD